MLQNDIHEAYMAVNRDGVERLHPAGRFLIADGHLHHLADYHGLLAREVPEGVVDDFTLAKISHPGSGLRTAARGAIRGGHRLDVVPEADLQPLPAPANETPGVAPSHAVPKPPPVWHYTRAGHDRPHVLEARAGSFTLDGNPLGHDEVGVILDNVRTRAARLRYAGSRVAAVAKMERAFADLRKADMDPQEALAHLDRLGDTDEKTSSAVQALRRHVFEDPMNPGVGNRYAYQEFRKKNTPGVWASIDLNDLKHLNDAHGHESGDALIRAFGQAARTGADPGKVKLFRSGGDEYAMHAPDEATAYNTVRSIRHHVDQIPPLHGVYKPSFSVGFGPSFEHADKALYQAKARKFKVSETGEQVRAFQPGAVPHFAHTLMPGSEGPVPLDEGQLQVHPPTLEQRPQVPEKTPLPPAPAHPAGAAQ